MKFYIFSSKIKKKIFMKHSSGNEYEMTMQFLVTKIVLSLGVAYEQCIKINLARKILMGTLSAFNQFIINLFLTLIDSIVFHPLNADSDRVSRYEHFSAVDSFVKYLYLDQTNYINILSLSYLCKSEEKFYCHKM